MPVHAVSQGLILAGSLCIVAGAILFSRDQERPKMILLTRSLIALGVFLVALSALIPMLPANILRMGGILK